MTKQLHFLIFYALLLCLPRVAWAQEPVVPDSALSSTLGLDQEEELPQSRYKLNVRGTVFENQSLKPLADATVKLTIKGGQLVAGAMTKENGQYVLQNVPSGSYTLRVTFMGFKEQTFALTLPEKNGNYKVTDVLMREEATMMQEAVVEGQMPEMTVVDDTVMYNADAFKVPEGSMIEEVIKKLPGVDQDENGNYTWNGKEISQILVDGKEFFGNNRQMTLQTLPADIVDKIKAYERKSDHARITGIDDGQERTVLDLQIKKDRKRGWMLDATGGFGSADRYQGDLNMRRFVGEKKYSVVSNANNTQGNGMADHQSLGFTMNYEKKKKLEVDGTVNANFNQNKNESSSANESFVNANSAFSNSANTSHGHSQNINLNYKVEWKPDTMTNILVRPNFSFSGSGNTGRSENATFRKDPYAVEGITDPLAQILSIPKAQRVNHRSNTNYNSSDSHNGSLMVQVNRRLRKRGRNVTLQMNGGFGASDSESGNFAHVDYYRLKAAGGGDSIYHKAQYGDTDNKRRNASAQISWNEPLADRLYLQATYQYSYSFTDNNRSVSTIFDPYNTLWGVDIDTYRSFRSMAPADTAQCNYTKNHYQVHRANLQLRLMRTQYRLTAGVRVAPQVNEVDYNKGFKHHDVRRSVVNAAPTINFRYRFSRQEELEVKYDGETGQPNITDLIPDTLNNASPLNIRLGNPGLKPSFTQKFDANYRKSFPSLQRSFTASAAFQTTQNSVSNMTQYDDETGGRVTRPENINGNWNGHANVNFNTALPRNKQFRINTNTSTNLTNAVSYVYINKEKATKKNRTRGLNVNQNLRLTYRNDWLEVTAHGSFAYHHSSTTQTSAGKLDTYRFTYGGHTQVQMPWHMTLSTDITQQSRRGYSNPAMNTNELFWNFQLTQRLLPRRNLLISLRAVDVLNEREDVNRRVTSTGRSDTRTRNIRSYYLLTLTYNFRTFGGRQMGRGGNRMGQGGGGGSRNNGNGGSRNNSGAGRNNGGGGNRGGGGGGNRF